MSESEEQPTEEGELNMPKTKAKTKTGKRAKVKKVMHEFKKGKLRSGSKAGPKVKSREQAVAIALNEAGMGRR